MNIPDWLAPHVLQKCPYCGSEITYNYMLTDAYCSNPNCPEHMAMKIDVLAKRLGIKNFGPASARALIERNNFTMHTQVIPIWFPKEKPSFYLHEVGELCLIKGYQKRWRQYCRGFDTMAQVCTSPFTPPDIKRHMVLLCCTERLVNVKPRLKGLQFNVMLTGSFQGYNNRKDFINEMNSLYGDVVQLVDVGTRRTDVQFLIKEPYAADHTKSALARAYGIQIISPAEMQERLKAAYSYILGGGETSEDS